MVCVDIVEILKIQNSGRIKIKKILNDYRSNDNNPDCIVALSGGRDSLWPSLSKKGIRYVSYSFYL